MLKVRLNIAGSLDDREVVCSTSDNRARIWNPVSGGHFSLQSSIHFKERLDLWRYFLQGRCHIIKRLPVSYDRPHATPGENRRQQSPADFEILTAEFLQSQKSHLLANQDDDTESVQSGECVDITISCTQRVYNQMNVLKKQ